MKQYTLYQAAKFSRISRYKLEQAIRKGLIKTTKGKGNVKCYINEDELKHFISRYGDQFMKFEDYNSAYGKSQTINAESDFVAYDDHNRVMEELDKRISDLTAETQDFLPLLSTSVAAKSIVESYDQRVQRFKLLAKEALDMASVFKKKEKEEIESQLTSI